MRHVGHLPRIITIIVFFYIEYTQKNRHHNLLSFRKKKVLTYTLTTQNLNKQGFDASFLHSPSFGVSEPRDSPIKNCDTSLKSSGTRQTHNPSASINFISNYLASINNFGETFIKFIFWYGHRRCCLQRQRRRGMNMTPHLH